MKNVVYFKKIIINCTVSVLIITGAIFLFIIPATNKLIAAKKNIKEQKEVLEKIYIQGQNLRKISENIKTVEPDLQNLEKMFIKKEGAIDFITSLEKTAENNNIKQRIGNLDYPAEETTKKKSFFQTVPLQITSSGSFLNQIKYLTSLEKLNYYISVKTIEISGNGGRNLMGENQNQNEIIDMQLTANTYWLK